MFNGSKKLAFFLLNGAIICMMAFSFGCDRHHPKISSGTTSASSGSAGITVSDISGDVTEAGGQATFTVVLNAEPEATVTVHITCSDETEGAVDTASLVFAAADWDQARSVTVTGQDDDVQDGNQVFEIDFSVTSGDEAYDGLALAGIRVTNIDDDDTPVADIEAVDDAWSETMYVGIDAIIPSVGLTQNDSNNVNSDPLEIVEVKTAVNCTATLSGDGSSITVNGTAVGTGSFVYMVQIEGDSTCQAEAAVTFTVSSVPSLLANNDSGYEVAQGGETYILASSLLANDVGSGLSVVSVGNPVGGTVSLDSGTITFTSTGISGELAYFEYTITDGSGTDTGLVYVTVTPLPAVEAYVYDDSDAFDTKMAAYQPPTILEVFNTWGRFLSTSQYWTDGTLATGTAASWTLIADEDGDGYIDGDLDADGTDDNATSFTAPGGNSGTPTLIEGDVDGDGEIDARFMQTANGSFNGFISPESYEDYTHEVTLWSADASDDDLVGVVAAFDHDGAGDGSYENVYVLYFGRSTGGYYPTSGWGLMLNSTQLVNISIDGASGYWGGTASGNPDTNHDDDKASRVKVVRNGDIITAYCTDWIVGMDNFDTPPDYNANSMITVDLSSTTDNITYISGGVTTYASADLTRFQSAKPYGYTNASQALSSYLNVSFEGGLDASTLILLSSESPTGVWNDSEVWAYEDGAWADQARTIQEELGYVRDVTNPETGTTYTILESTTELAE